MRMMLIEEIMTPHKKGNKPDPGFLKVPKPIFRDTIIMARPEMIRTRLSNSSPLNFSRLPIRSPYGDAFFGETPGQKAAFRNDRELP
jgi:hypothetical protein